VSQRNLRILLENNGQFVIMIEECLDGHNKIREMVGWILFPVVWLRTGRPVVMLLFNALGHRNKFTRENVTVNFSTKCYVMKTTNGYEYHWCTWDEIQAHFAKRDYFAFVCYQKQWNKNGLRQEMLECFQKPPTLLDAAHYIQEAWSANYTVYNEKLFCKGRYYWFSSWIWLYQPSRIGWHGVLA